MLSHESAGVLCSGAHIEIIQSLAALESIRPEWDELHARAFCSTPFQSAAWLLPWARHYARDRLQAVAARENGTLVMLVPFFVWQRRLLLAGTGPTDYCDGIFAREDSHADANTVLQVLVDIAEELGCESIDLQQLPSWSPLVRARDPDSWKSILSAGEPCLVAPLEGGMEHLPISSKWRKHIAQAMRRLTRVSPAHLDFFSNSVLETAAEVVRRLHCARWNQRGGGVFSDPLAQRFLDSVLPELSAAGSLRLHILHVGACPIAALLGLRGREMSCFYIGGFDPKWARYSPGSITLLAAIEGAALEGAREFHFLRGREPYKYHFGARDTSTYQRVLVPLR
jgi:CelD/BcsL family acetyltransferase involved in cellulose biosynthesis